MYEHVIRAVFDEPWAIAPAKLAAIAEVVRLRASGLRLPQAEVDAIVAAAPRPGNRSSGAVAVINVFGTIAQRANLMSEMSGGTSTEQLAALVRQAVTDETVGAIVLNIDSPGGAVAGVPELADVIHGARGPKPIVAHANAFAASAAYWLGAQADEFVITPSGQVGSIGVAYAHIDKTAAMEQAGIKIEYITAGRHKREITSDTPLDDDARSYVQGMVNQYYDMFVKAVARGRGVTPAAVRDGMGEGRMLTARDALKAGMVDRIEPLDQTIARLQGSGRSRGRMAADELIVPLHSLSPETREQLREVWASQWRGPVSKDDAPVIDVEQPITSPEVLSDEPETARENGDTADLDRRRRRLRLLSHG